PSGQGEHSGPPQSTAVSLPFFAPSLQVGAGSVVDDCPVVISVVAQVVDSVALVVVTAPVVVVAAPVVVESVAPVVGSVALTDVASVVDSVLV
ncbi:MAG TPA: hypothetical protein PKW35_20650, partial [Nannocystaceae bacterium]|nr:hypothetical protein [Nannocystaceae bacterium]